MVTGIAKAIAALCAAAASVTPAPAQQWQLQYEYDQVKSALALTDVQFTSPTRGIAVGLTVDTAPDSRRSRTGLGPVALSTTDGGAHWEITKLKEVPVSLFFLNDSLGWLVTEKGLWKTEEGGKDWVKLPNPHAEITRVWFNDPQNGWAACGKKKVLETHDGAKHWTPMKKAAELPGDAQASVYNLIAFNGGNGSKQGVIAGLNQPPRLQRFADWLDPAAELGRRELPHLLYLLQTNDGGATWTSSSASMFGEISRVRFGPNNLSLILVEHEPSFTYPSEVHRATVPNGMIFRQKNFFISDIWVTPQGTCYLAGIEVNSKLRSVVPQKVMVVRSQDLTNWTSLPVDYRAVANRVFLAGSGEQMWLATNNGMLLKLQ